ncbi:site-specific integrase [Roseibium suaedae]|uniref:integrase n=1 Tax=Roseibium suaedae TaxID=735517 RepID=UPI001F3E0DAB|nr:integrase [Roseibium suaedae]
MKLSTKVRVGDDPACLVAGPIVDRLNREAEAYWAGLASGRVDAAAERYHEAVRRARARGFAYQSVRELADPSSAWLGDVLTRVEAVSQRSSTVAVADADAFLGGLEPPKLRISDLFEEFEKSQKVYLRDLAEDQKRKWRNPKLRALENLLKVIDDKPLLNLTREDAIEFRAWWQDRIVSEDMNADTANKDFGHINKMLKTLILERQLLMDTPFRELRFPKGAPPDRQAYDPAYVQDRLLPGLSGLNAEARAVVCVIAETGARLSEVCNARFILDHDVPHLSILADERKTKTWQSVREIPLVGVGLAAARAFPNGFPRYRHKADGLSGLVNHYLSDNGLRPSSQHTLYSLRHTFEDRLTAAEAPDKIAAALMGHKYHRPRYGTGPTLEQKQKWLQAVAYQVDMVF